MQVVKIFICPSDPLNQKVTTYTTGGQTYYFGMNSYLANAGTRSWYITSMTTDGMFWINSKVTVDGVVDGTSNTLLFGERYHKDPAFDSAVTSNQQGMDVLGGWAWANYNAPQDYFGSTPVPVNFQLAVGTPTGSPSFNEDNRICAFGSAHSGRQTSAWRMAPCDFSPWSATPTCRCCRACPPGLVAKSSAYPERDRNTWQTACWPQV